MNFMVYGGLPEGEKARLVNMLTIPSDVRYKGRLITTKPNSPHERQLWADEKFNQIWAWANGRWVSLGLKASDLILWQRPKETEGNEEEG